VAARAAGSAARPAWPDRRPAVQLPMPGGRLITPSPRAAPVTVSPARRRVGHDREGSGTATSTRSFVVIEKLVGSWKCRGRV